MAGTARGDAGYVPYPAVRVMAKSGSNRACAVGLPFFSDGMGLAAALCAILLSFTFPMLLGKELIRNMTPREVLITNLALPVTVAVAIAGTAASVASIVGNLSSGKPFQC